MSRAEEPALLCRQVKEQEKEIRRLKEENGLLEEASFPIILSSLFLIAKKVSVTTQFSFTVLGFVFSVTEDSHSS